MVEKQTFFTNKLTYLSSSKNGKILNLILSFDLRGFEKISVEEIISLRFCNSSYNRSKRKSLRCQHFAGASSFSDRHLPEKIITSSSPSRVKDKRFVNFVK